MPKTTEILKGSLQRRASFVPESANKDERTIDVVFATETPVLLTNWSVGRYWEILVCDDTAGDLTRLNNGAPICDTHDTYSVRDGLGSVVRGSAKFVNGQGVCTLRFSKRADVEPIWQDVLDGHISGISIQFQPYEYTETDNVENTIPTFRCTKWEGMEVSLALVQKDRNSSVRSNDNTEHEVTFIRKNSKENTMKRTAADIAELNRLCRAANLTDEFAADLIAGEQTMDQCRAAIAAKKQTPLDEAAIEKRAVEAERKRVADITIACRNAKLDDAFKEELIAGGENIDHCRAKIIDKLAESDPAKPAPQGRATVGQDEVDKRRSAIITGMSLRAAVTDVKKLKAEDVAAAREFRSMTLLDIAKDCLTRAGVDYRGLDKMEIALRAITSSTSDFPILLGGVIHQTLLNNYQAVADTWRNFCSIGSVSDFRPYKRLRMGSFSRLDKVQENGEFKNKKIPDAEFESIQAQTYGNVINVSRQMIVNDDLQAFAKLSSMLGRAAARSIELDVYALLASNPELEDGVTLFHVSHGNLGTAGVPSVAAFDEMRVLMAKQKDPSNNDFLDIRPSVLLIGMSKGGDARVINGSQYDPDAANKLQRPNKVYGLFSNVVDTAQIPGTEYYAFADPAQEPVFEVSFLDGNQTPYLEMKPGFNVDGVEWKVRHDYAVGAVGYRGVVKNAGA